LFVDFCSLLSCILIFLFFLFLFFLHSDCLSKGH
jgi:hypothetical protein